MSSLFFVQRAFEWGWGNGFGWRGRCRDWGKLPPSKCLKKPDFKTNIGVL